MSMTASDLGCQVGSSSRVSTPTMRMLSGPTMSAPGGGVGLGRGDGVEPATGGVVVPNRSAWGIVLSTLLVKTFTATTIPVASSTTAAAPMMTYRRIFLLTALPRPRYTPDGPYRSGRSARVGILVCQTSLARSVTRSPRDLPHGERSPGAGLADVPLLL